MAGRKSAVFCPVALPATAAGKIIPAAKVAQSFDMYDSTDIIKITLCLQNGIIRSMTVQYKDEAGRTRSTGLFGGSGGNPVELQLEDIEDHCIQAMKASSDSTGEGIKSLSFTISEIVRVLTSSGTVDDNKTTYKSVLDASCGTAGDTLQLFNQERSKIVGFHGTYSDEQLLSIGVYWGSAK